jgi:putative serine protease PepD
MNQPSNTPWWLPSDEVKQVRVVQTKSNSNFIIFAVVIALVAGALGAMVGRSSSTNIGANLVDTKNTVERAPDSIAALAARVFRQLCRYQLILHLALVFSLTVMDLF